MLSRLLKKMRNSNHPFFLRYKYNRTLFLYALFSVILFSFGAPLVYSQSIQKIKLAAFDYPPFYIQETNTISGIGVELIRVVSERLNKEADIRMLPLKRGLQNLKTGETDAIMILIKNKERSRYITYTDTVMTVRGLIWKSGSREDININFKEFKDLSQYQIGVTLGYSYGQAFDDFLKTASVYVAPRDLNNYRMLLANRIDIFPGNEIVAKGLFKKYPELKGRFTHSDRSFIEWELHMGISKKSELITEIDQINKILFRMKKDGFIEQAVQKYTE